MNLVWPREQPILRGNHFALRPWRPGDAEAVNLACQDPDIQHYTVVPVPYSLADAQAFVASGEQAWADRSQVHFAIVDLTDKVLGSISFVRLNAPERKAEIGYWVAPWGRGKGAANTAVGLIADFGRELGFEEFVMRIEDQNVASIATAVAAGAMPTGESEEVELKGTDRKMLFFRLI